MLVAFNIIAMWIYSTWISIKTRATLHSNLWEHVFIGCMLRVWNNKQYRRGCRSRPSTLYCHNNIESTPQEIIGTLPSSCCTEFKFLQQEIYKYSCLNCDINKAVSKSEVPCLQLTRYYGKVYFKVCSMEEHSHQAQPMHHLLSKTTTWRKKNTLVLYTITGDITFHPMFLRPQEDVSQHEIKTRSRVAHYTQDRLILKVKSVHHNRGEMMTGWERTGCIEICN